MRPLVVAAFLMVGCSNKLDPETDTTVDTDTSDDTDTDTVDTDTETDTVDTDTETETDNDSDTDTADPSPWELAQDTLRNQSLAYPGRCTPSSLMVIQPYPEEHQHWGASRLTPSEYPFEVDAIQIELEHTPDTTGCRANSPRTVRVLKATGATPPATPSSAPGVQTYNLTGRADVIGWFIRKQLDTPITLNEGESLFVIVQVEASSSGKTCFKSCADGFQEEHNWWSNRSIEPFPAWGDIGEAPFNLRQNYLIEAYDY
jgi:hypothetical protein